MDISGSHGFSKQTIHCISYNPDCSFIAIATNRGFKIYSTNPFQLKQYRDFGAPIQLIQMINRSNLIAMVGFRDTPFAPPNKLIIYDDDSQRIIADLAFKSSIKCIVIRQKKMLVALYNKVFVIGLFSMEVEHVISTFKFEESEKYSIISLSNDPDNLIMAAPSIQNGHVLLVYFNRATQRKIKAHQSILSAVQLSPNGQKLATTSQKGIQIRIFSTRTGDMIQEVRRGNQFANIYSLVWSRQANWLAVSSDSHNVHIFAIKPSQKQKQKNYQKMSEKNNRENPKSMLYFIKNIFPYFDAQYSYANYKIQDYETEMQTFLGFDFENDSLLMMNNFGVFQKLQMNQKGGKLKQVQRKQIFESE